MSVRARGHESRRDCKPWLAIAATVVQEARPVWPIGLMLQIKQSAVDGHEQVAPRTPHPTWEGDDGDTNASPIVERIACLLEPRSGTQRLDLLHVWLAPNCS